MTGMRGPSLPALLFGLIYAVYVCYNLNLFYIHGSASDPGWFAWLTSNVFIWPAPAPQSIGGSFFSQHLSLIFFITSWLLQPIAVVPYTVKFCFVFSLWLPLFWAAMVVLLQKFSALSRPVRYALAFLLTMNGLNFSMFGFPHIESFIPALAILGLAIWFWRDDGFGFFACLAFIFIALLIREDAGLHIFLALAALIVAESLGGVRIYRRGLGVLAAFCLLYSIAALMVQKLFVPSGGEQLGAVFFGRPPFATLSAHVIFQRLEYWLTRRAYIFLPLVILAAALPVFKLDRRLLLGVVIACPWLALSLLAFSSVANELYDYYCFPILFAFFWPLLLAQIAPGRQAIQCLWLQFTMGALSTGIFVLVGVLAFTGDGGAHDKAPWLHLMPPGPGLIAKTQSVIAASGPVLVDNGVAALGLGPIEQYQHRGDAEAFTTADIARANGYLRFVTAPAPYLAVRAAMLAAAFPDCARIAGTYLEMCRKG